MDPSNIKQKIRHAEKCRAFSTCSFADRVCLKAKEVLRDKAPTFLQVQLKDTLFLESLSQEERQQLENNMIKDGENIFVADKDFAYNILFVGGQNVFAAVLIHDDHNDELKCVSMGIGTKFLRDQHCNSKCGGLNAGFSHCSRDHSRVRDMHAEVMAKKGFMRYLAGRFDRTTGIQVDDSIGPTSLPANQTVHFYVSSSPCGNSIIKKWAKPSLGIEFTDLEPNEWPGKNSSKPGQITNKQKSGFSNKSQLILESVEGDQINANHTHNNVGSIQTEREARKLVKRLKRQVKNNKSEEKNKMNWSQPFHFTAKEEGQGAVLCKGRTFSNAEKATLSFDIPNATQIWQGKISGKKIKLDNCSETENNKHVKQGPFTCSDKLLLWQHLGFQGSRLSHLVTSVSLSTVTVGRKFSLPHLERALFGRFNLKYQSPVKQKPVVCMVTELKFDENVLEDSDASFEDARCYWWAHSEYGKEELEILNGSEGRVYGTNEKSLLVPGLKNSGDFTIYAAEYKANKEFLLDYLETLKPTLKNR